jgi:ParB family chromosome partitioning protein
MTHKQGFVDSRQYLEEELQYQRELEALLPARRVAVKNLPIRHIQPNPYQARQKFSNLDKLARSVRDHGFATCLLWVRPDPSKNGYVQLLFGERWLHAAKEAGLHMVPCEIALYTDEELFIIGMAENIRQRDLDPLEEAFVFRDMVEQRGYTLYHLSKRIGQNVEYISQRLELLSMPADQLQQHAHPGRQAVTYRAPRSLAAAEREAANSERASGTRADGRLRGNPRDEVALRSASTRQSEKATFQYSAAQSLDSPHLVRRAVERDIHILRGIFARWQNLLARGDSEQLILAEYLGEVLQEVEQLIGRSGHRDKKNQ